MYGRLNEEYYNRVMVKFEWLDGKTELYQEMKHPDPLDEMIKTSKRIDKERENKFTC
jgi:hypothetical protein